MLHAVRNCTVKNHIYSGNKHSDSKAKLVKKEARELQVDIAHSLVSYRIAGKVGKH